MEYTNIDIPFNIMPTVTTLLVSWFIAAILFVKNSKNRQPHLPTNKATAKDAGILVICAGLFVTVLVALGTSSIQAQEQMNALEENLTKKYDIASVGEREGQEVPLGFGPDKTFPIIVTHENTRHQFLVSYNPETDEPTLMDMPDDLGEPAQNAVRAEDLLRK